MIRRLKSADLIELTSFGLVGLTAMAVHFAAAIAAIELLGLPIWLANILAFLMAVPVSYVGHSLFTFSAARYGRKGHVTGRTTARFLIVALSGFALNEASVLILTYQFAVPHRLAILFTLLGVAGLLYLSSKFWAYRSKRPKLAAEPVPITKD
ncbi:MAG: GtrA family protein [Hyphomonas sp.]|nr:GtrA family protein [Hyphomonas sp.]